MKFSCREPPDTINSRNFHVVKFSCCRDFPFDVHIGDRKNLNWCTLVTGLIRKVIHVTGRGQKVQDWGKIHSLIKLQTHRQTPERALTDRRTLPSTLSASLRGPYKCCLLQEGQPCRYAVSAPLWCVPVWKSWLLCGWRAIYPIRRTTSSKLKKKS